MSEFVSVWRYAKMIGTSHQNLKGIINSGRLVNSYDPKTGKIDAVKADKEWGLNFQIKKLSRGLIAANREDEQNKLFPDGLAIEDITINPDDTLPELERKHTAITAKRALLKLKVEQGELIPKEKVHKDLFTIGKQVRNNLQIIPDRITDQLLTTVDRDTRVKLLQSAIEEALTPLNR